MGGLGAPYPLSLAFSRDGARRRVAARKGGRDAVIFVSLRLCVRPKSGRNSAHTRQIKVLTVHGSHLCMAIMTQSFNLKLRMGRHICSKKATAYRA